MKHVEIYTDGACKGNPGRGGWGCILTYNGHERELFGGEAQTTNNRMELQAVIEGVKALKEPCNLTIYSDSQYVVQAMTKWLPGWKAKNWKGVKNVDLIQELDRLLFVGRHYATFVKVKGHSGHIMNERADALANKGCL
nr:MAG TPA: ribonuclease HI [Caudoviricetes sp.]